MLGFDVCRFVYAASKLSPHLFSKEQEKPHQEPLLCSIIPRREGGGPSEKPVAFQGPSSAAIWGALPRGPQPRASSSVSDVFTVCSITWDGTGP